MRDRPAGLTEDELCAALDEGWGLRAESVTYLPVGAGSYHWSVADRFVKVDHVAGLDDLRRSLATAAALSLDGVVAPVPALDGAVVRRLGDLHAVSVYPMVEGDSGSFGPHRAEDLPELASLLAAVHRATPLVAHLAPPRTEFRLPGRAELLEALRDLDRPWTGGPHSEPARALLTRHRGQILEWLAEFDRLAATVASTAADWVVTHGEPHPGNLIRTGAGLRLIDWTTVRIAPPERDLWMLTRAFTDLLGAEPPAFDALAHYTAATGRAVSVEGVALYQRWWVLADVAAFTADLRNPHSDGEDAAAALVYLAGYFTP